MTRISADTVFAKTHNALVEDRGTPMITLEHTAGAIYVVRDPLDVAVSYSHHYGVALDEAVAAMNRHGNQSIANQENFAYELHGTWSENVESWTAHPNPSLHVVRYEDMAREPQRTFAAIAGFLGVSASPARIAAAVERSSFATLKDQERRRGFRERSRKSDEFFRTGEIGQGRRLLPAVLIDRLAASHEATMARFGYWPAAGGSHRSGTVG